MEGSAHFIQFRPLPPSPLFAWQLYSSPPPPLPDFGFGSSCRGGFGFSDALLWIRIRHYVGTVGSGIGGISPYRILILLKNGPIFLSVHTVHAAAFMLAAVLCWTPTYNLSSFSTRHSKTPPFSPRFYCFSQPRMQGKNLLHVLSTCYWWIFFMS